MFAPRNCLRLTGSGITNTLAEKMRCTHINSTHKEIPAKYAGHTYRLFKIEDFPQRYGIRIGGNHSFSPKIEEGRLCETSLTYLTFQNVKGFLYIYIYSQLPT